MKNLITIILFSTLGGSITYFLINHSSKSAEVVLPIVENNKEN